MLPLLLACTPEGPDAASLLAALGACTPLDGTQPFATDVSDAGRPTGQSVDLCGLDGAVWWTADLDVDAETAVASAAGEPLDGSTVPYVVVPLPWTGFSDRDADFFYCDHGLTLGGPVAVVHDGIVTYGVIGDEGPVITASGSDGTCAGEPDSGGVVGGASAAMAAALGIDASSGLDCDGDCPVTYVLFEAGAVDPIEDPAAATRAGVELALGLTGG